MNQNDSDRLKRAEDMLEETEDTLRLIIPVVIVLALLLGWHILHDMGVIPQLYWRNNSAATLEEEPRHDERQK